MRFCKERLRAEFIPSRFVEFDELPVNLNGKVLKSKLAEALAVV